MLSLARKRAGGRPPLRVRGDVAITDNIYKQPPMPPAPCCTRRLGAACCALRHVKRGWSMACS